MFNMMYLISFNFSVSSIHVLFAAHCVENKKSITTQTESSSFRIQDYSDEDKTPDFEISEIIVHPDWDTLTKPYEADIAIAILEEPVEFPNVTNICLNSPSKSVEEFIGQSGVVAGWGHTEASFEAANELRAVTVPIVDRYECTESPVFREIYSETLFCAGDTKQKAGPCKGEKSIIDFHSNLFIVSLI
jgi:secreted trypsin-like serine protease